MTALDPSTVRDRVWERFFESQDENDRIALLSMYHAAMRLALGQLTAGSPEFDRLRRTIETDKCAFVILEAMVDDTFFDADEFDRIVDREVAASRMDGREFANHAREAAKMVREQRAASWARKAMDHGTLQ